MIITNNQNLPQALVDAVSRDYKYRDKRYSVTSILKPLRQMFLERRHTDEITQDVSDMLWLILGSAVHKIIQESDTTDGQYKEEPVSIQVGDYTLSGIVDLYDIDKEIVSDWKSVSVYKYKNGNWDEYINQLLLYAYMLINNGLEVKKIQIVPMYKDFRKAESKRGDYPKYAIGLVEQDVTYINWKYVEDKINAKFQEIAKYEDEPDDNLPICTEEERWAEPTMYALMKKGRVKAIKKYETFDEANDEAKKDKDYYVEIRKGVDRRCTEYCSCNKFCSYWKENYGKVDNQ